MLSHAGIEHYGKNSSLFRAGDSSKVSAKGAKGKKAKKEKKESGCLLF
jgi:hypothetical protein